MEQSYDYQQEAADQINFQNKHMQNLVPLIQMMCTWITTDMDGLTRWQANGPKWMDITQDYFPRWSIHCLWIGDQIICDSTKWEWRNQCELRGGEIGL